MVGPPGDARGPDRVRRRVVGVRVVPRVVEVGRDLAPVDELLVVDRQQRVRLHQLLDVVHGRECEVVVDASVELGHHR